jgi:hypothetical protein
MDAAAKAQLEKRAVLGLGAVFLVVFARGPMKSLGFFQAPRGPMPAESVGKVAVTKSVSGMLRDGWEKIDQKVGAIQSQAEEAPLAAGAVAYSASGLRDPLKSLLPKTVPQHLAELSVKAAEEPPPPPALRIDGLVWGGAEPQAIIGGRVYRVNDTVEGARIVAIRRGGVTIEHLGKPVVYSTAGAQ